MEDSSTNSFRAAQFLAAFGGIVTALVVLYYAIVTPIPEPPPYLFRSRAAIGAGGTIVGLSIWVLVQLKVALLNRLTGNSYVVSVNGREESFKTRSEANAKIGELRSNGTSIGDIRLEKVETQTNTRGSVVIRKMNIPVE